MSQFYPGQSPYYPPPQGPEEEYYDDYEFAEDEYDDEIAGDPVSQRLLIFLSGGCLVFLCVGCCLFMLVGGLFLSDPLVSLFPASPPPGSDIGLTFEEPAFPDETVVNEDGVQLSIATVNRNVALPGLTPVEGRELIVVTIELTNLSNSDVDYSEDDFILINQREEAYTVSSSASFVDGALGEGTLAPNEGFEARLVFELLSGEVNLVLGWEGGPDVEPRYIYIE